MRGYAPHSALFYFCPAPSLSWDDSFFLFFNIPVFEKVVKQNANVRFICTKIRLNFWILLPIYTVKKMYATLQVAFGVHTA